MKHRGWIAFSGFVWLCPGLWLLFKGLRLISEAAHRTDSLCYAFKDSFGSPEQAATVLIAIGLLLGFLKGRIVFAKTVQRISLRILSLPLPIRFFSVYPPVYWILIGSMVLMGMALRFSPLPVDARGLIDVAIGSALVNGAMLYFRSAKVART